ncbi:MAG: hypothetical protein ACQGVK_08170 [Myxococcota bacterium]
MARSSRLGRGLRGLAACGVALSLVALAAPRPAEASPETLSRSVGNMVQAPLDLALSPLVAWATLNNNIQDIDDTTAVRVAYYLPGYVWLLGLQVGASAIRGLTGAIEFLPGLFLLPFDADLDPLYDPVERGEALVEWENPVMDIKFGINYQSPAF